MQLFDTLVPADFRAVLAKPLTRFYLGSTLRCVGGASLFDSSLILGLRRQLSAHEDGTALESEATG